MNEAVLDIYLKILYEKRKIVIRQYSNIIEFRQKIKTFHEELGGLWKEEVLIYNYSVEDSILTIGFKYPMRR